MHAAAGRILRVTSESGSRALAAFLSSPAAAELEAAGRLVSTRRVEAAEALELLGQVPAGATVFEHDRLPFPSYPYEWPPEMLHAAGRLTLDLAERLLADGWGLKDATPYNVLFRGPVPVFVDVLSIEARDPRDAIWLPYAQFVRTFLLPLLAARRFGLTLRQVFEASRDGLEPEAVYRFAGPVERLLPPFLSLVTLPTWLGGRRGRDASVYRRPLARTPDEARHVLGFLFRRLRRLLERLAPETGRRSAWSDYAAASDARVPDRAGPGRGPELAAKGEIVDEVMRDFRPRTVLDVGCNTGYFAARAARSGARVVAIDQDPVVVGETWRRAVAERLDVLPLVVDLARPSPATGWKNRECPSFLDRVRAADGFDAVLFFAVIHHLLVTERIPLDDLLDLVAEVTRDVAVIEFVPPQDPLFRTIVRGREALHADLTAEAFERQAGRRFRVLGCRPVPGTARRAYLLRKR